MSASPVFSVDNIKNIEAAYVKQKGIELYQLMERAGEQAFRQIKTRFPDIHHYLIATGAGNNAGDGLVVARHALQAGCSVTLVALKDYQDFEGDPLRAWQALESVLTDTASHNKKTNQSFEVIDFEGFLELDIEQFEIVVDALLGTGVSMPLRPQYADLIVRLNDIHCPKIALDIPTGIYADSGCVATERTDEGELEVAFHADYTLCFVALKAGQLLNSALHYQGQLIVDDLGIDDVMSYGYPAEAQHIELIDVQSQLIARQFAGSKFDCGHVLLVGGGEHLGGAIILSATTAIKSGAGIVSCWLEVSNRSAALAHCPEVMWRGLTTKDEVGEELEQQVGRFQSIVLGPGLGRDARANKCFSAAIKVLRESESSLVLDADGLYWLAQHPLDLPSNTVITPHAGEAVRLLNARQEDVLASGRIEPQLSVDTAYVEHNRIKVAEELARKYQVICVLKGAGTVISDGDKTYLTAGAHPAMMTAGLGDVLAGLIGSLIAQGVSVMDAAVLATSLHFEAAKSVANGRHRGVLASEVIDELNVWINRLNN